MRPDREGAAAAEWLADEGQRSVPEWTTSKAATDMEGSSFGALLLWIGTANLGPRCDPMTRIGAHSGRFLAGV